MLTYKDKEEFITNVISSDLMNNAIAYISKNVDPEDVFTKRQLTSWADDHYECSREHVE